MFGTSPYQSGGSVISNAINSITGLYDYATGQPYQPSVQPAPTQPTLFDTYNTSPFSGTGGLLLIGGLIIIAFLILK